MGKVFRQKRLCKECPRRELAHNQDVAKYYCISGGFFNDEEHSCSPRRKISRLTRLHNRMAKQYMSHPQLCISDDYPARGVTVCLKKPIEPNNIVFQIKDKEILKLCEDGTIYINGRLAGNDREVVEGMRELIKGFRRN